VIAYVNYMAVVATGSGDVQANYADMLALPVRLWSTVDAGARRTLRRDQDGVGPLSIRLGGSGRRTAE
jgi:hypothetical protein